MLSKAKVYTHPLSPYYQAWFEVWDAERQKWKACTKSTRSTDRDKALEIAQEYERVALAAGGPDGSTRLSRDFIQNAVDSILKTSGHRPVQHQQSWKAYSEKWLAHQRKRVPKSLSSETMRVYDRVVRQFNAWLGKGANNLLGAFTGDQLQEWYHSELETGMATGTLNKHANQLTTIFERARNEGLLTHNPAKLITRDNSGGNTRDAFTMAQMHTILDYLRRSTDPVDQEWLTVALLGFCTTQRLADCARSTRSQFHEGDTWWTWNIVPSKTARTGKKLRIPLVEPVASHIQSLLQQQPSSLFLTPILAETRTDGPAGLSMKFSRILTACGIEGRVVQGTGAGNTFRSLTFHCTRHTGNTLLAEAGIPEDIRRLITGHADVKTNLGYTHLSDNVKGKALTKAFKPQTVKKTPAKKKPKTQAA